MVDEPASQAQRRRSAALVVLMLALAAAGAAGRAPRSGQAPAPCPSPSFVDGIVVCDGPNTPHARGTHPLGARAWLMGTKLDVNTASAGDIEAVPGVGPSLAHAIVDARASRGRFTRIEDLDDVPGVGPKTLAKLTVYLEVR